MATIVVADRPRPLLLTREVVPRLLGAAFLVVIATSLVGGLLLGAALGDGAQANLLPHLATRLTLARAGVVVDLGTSVGIVTLAALLYAVLHPYARNVARIAFGCWLLEAMFMALSRLGALALVHLSERFIDAGSPTSSAYQVVGDALYRGLYTPAYTVHMFFYGVGGLLWYGLFYRSATVPRAIALLGLLAAAVGLGGIIVELFGPTAPTIVFLPLLGFELLIGGWLLLRGIGAERQPTERERG